MQNEKVICNKFSFAYDSNTFGIHDIDLTIQEGEFIVLTGKSGCGKTTLTRCINGLIPDFFEGTITGSCRVCGMDISEHETGDYSSYVGSVFQDPRSQFFTLHVKTEIPFPSENLGTPSSVIQDRFRNTVKQLNISNLLKKSIFELSSGEKQKVAIASIYTANVQIYVLDEPSANLDWEGTKQLKKLLGQLKEQGCTIIISEHKLYYLKDLAEEEVYAAAKAAQCHEFIEKLPKGYDTLIGEGGVYLSGGEEQRVAVARAILKNAPILILDEATAYADPENEYQMQLALQELIKNKTVLIIAHRLITIKNANKIEVINEGKIEAEGTHDELLQKSKTYSAMWDAYTLSSDWQISKKKEVAQA